MAEVKSNTTIHNTWQTKDGRPGMTLLDGFILNGGWRKFTPQGKYPGRSFALSLPEDIIETMKDLGFRTPEVNPEYKTGAMNFKLAGTTNKISEYTKLYEVLPNGQVVEVDTTDDRNLEAMNRAWYKGVNLSFTGVEGPDGLYSPWVNEAYFKLSDSTSSSLADLTAGQYQTPDDGSVISDKGLPF